MLRLEAKLDQAASRFRPVKYVPRMPHGLPGSVTAGGSLGDDQGVCGRCDLMVMA